MHIHAYSWALPENECVFETPLGSVLQSLFVRWWKYNRSLFSFLFTAVNWLEWIDSIALVIGGFISFHCRAVFSFSCSAMVHFVWTASWNVASCAQRHSGNIAVTFHNNERQVGNSSSPGATSLQFPAHSLTAVRHCWMWRDRFPLHPCKHMEKSLNISWRQ